MDNSVEDFVMDSIASISLQEVEVDTKTFLREFVCCALKDSRNSLSRPIGNLRLAADHEGHPTASNNPDRETEINETFQT